MCLAPRMLHYLLATIMYEGNKKFFFFALAKENVVIPLSLKKIYSPEEEQQRADKALRLNGVSVDIFIPIDSDSDYNPKLLTASSSTHSLTTPNQN
jgi:hypothetical protein